MKKLINDPANYVDEMLDGLCLAHPGLKRVGDDRRAIARNVPMRQGKVGVVSGGGSGHLPLFTGYVGQGLLDACAIGNVFEGPTINSCQDAIAAANGGAGVLCLFGNYGGNRTGGRQAGRHRPRQRPRRRQCGARCCRGTSDPAGARQCAGDCAEKLFWRSGSG